MIQVGLHLRKMKVEIRRKNYKGVLFYETFNSSKFQEMRIKLNEAIK